MTFAARGSSSRWGVLGGATRCAFLGMLFRGMTRVRRACFRCIGGPLGSLVRALFGLFCLVNGRGGGFGSVTLGGWPLCVAAIVFRPPPLGMRRFWLGNRGGMSGFGCGWAWCWDPRFFCG